MSDHERSTLERALLDPDRAALPPAETLQAEACHCRTDPSWSADRAHARLRLLAGMVGLVGSAMIVAILIMGEAAHG